MYGKEIRINRLFNGDKNVVIIAIDHGMFDGPIPGMINLKETIGKISPIVDGILISPGMLRECGSAFSLKGAPVPIVRIIWSDIYCFHWNYNQANTVVAMKVKDAVAAGAEMVVISLTIATGDPAVLEEVVKYKESLKKKIVQANEELQNVKYEYKTN